MTQKKYFASRIKSFADAVEGINYVLRTQKNARIHAAITLAVLIIALVFRISSLEWLILILVIGMVWSAEIFNTAVETLVDMVSPEHHRGAGVIKDVSAGAVFVSAVVSFLVGLLIFGPRLWDLIRMLFS